MLNKSIAVCFFINNTNDIKINKREKGHFSSAISNNHHEKDK